MKDGIKKKRLISDMEKTVTYIQDGNTVVKPIRQEVPNKYEPRAGDGNKTADKDFVDKIVDKVMEKLEGKIVERILERLG